LFEKRTDDTQSSLDKTIASLMDDMSSMDGDSEEYATCMNRLERLYKLKEKNAPKRVSPDTIALVVGNLTGIFIIVAYEHGRVITSKAMSQLGKLR
jgi:hypothetical protein